MEKVFVFIMENGKKLQFDESLYEYKFITDKNGAIVVVNVINKNTNQVRNRINFSHVLYICDHVKKYERKPRGKFSEIEGEQDKFASIQQEDAMIGSIDSDILDEIRDELIEESESDE